MFQEVFSSEAMTETAGNASGLIFSCKPFQPVSVDASCDSSVALCVGWVHSAPLSEPPVLFLSSLLLPRALLYDRGSTNNIPLVSGSDVPLLFQGHPSWSGAMILLTL